MFQLIIDIQNIILHLKIHRRNSTALHFPCQTLFPFTISKTPGIDIIITSNQRAARVSSLHVGYRELFPNNLGDR